MLEAFNPQGNTTLISVTTTATTSVQPSTGAVIGGRIANLGSSPVWIATGGSGITATLPTSAAAANAFPIMASSVETFTFSPNFYISAITTSGTATLTITPGFGI